MNEVIKAPETEITTWWVSKKISHLVSSVGRRLWVLRPEYPTWKHLIPEYPSEQEMREAFKYLSRSCVILEWSRVLPPFSKEDRFEILSDRSIRFNDEIYTLTESTSSIDVFHNDWFYPEECSDARISEVDGEGINLNFNTPNNWSFHFWGVWGYTDQPNISKNFIYSWVWCDWDTDKDGVRYYLIDKETWFPRDWEYAKATEIFRNYFLNVLQWDMQNLIWKS